MAHTNLGTSSGDTLTSANVNKCLAHDGSNNWGIGTESPTRKLDVEFSGTGSGGVQLNNVASGGNSWGVIISDTADGDSAGVGAFYLRNDTSGGNKIVIQTNGNVRFGSYGAGTLVTDSSGNITASSDRSLKTKIKKFVGGLAEVLKLKPVTYKWNDKTNNEQENRYSGFIAQEVEEVLEHTVYGEEGAKTLNDRGLICALVNAVQELNQKVETLESKLS